MRHAFSQRCLQTETSTKPLDREVDPWEIICTYVEGAASLLGLDTTANFLSAIWHKDVRRLFENIELIDKHLIVYDASVNVALIRAERQLVCLLKKYPFGSDSPFDTRQTAVDNLRLAEIQCASTNHRILASATFPSWVPLAQSLIRDCLGELTPSRIMSMISDGSHGPGATLSNSGNRTTPYYKFMDLPYTCTKKALPYAYAAISCNPRWIDLLESKGVRSRIPPIGCSQLQKEITLLSHCVEIVSSDKITFVPKDAKKDRPIAIGASMNIFLQLGVKAEMEECLRRQGVDLRDQGKNQAFAKSGSLFCYTNGVPNPMQYSTLDLSNASDTVSYEIVRLLLDPLWFAFLCDLRFEQGDLDGELISYEKFSAMGNGFTFPLESLIFWAIAKAVTIDQLGSASNRDIAIYGDDIIVRQTCSESVIAALQWAGFSLNLEKSFISGYFKESCGADYFRGHNVRPFYLKRVLATHEDIYFACNSIADLCMAYGVNPGLQSVYSFLLSKIRASDILVLPLTSNSDLGLRIPLSCTGRVFNRRPYLSEREFCLLQSKGFIPRQEQFIANSPYVCYHRYVAVTYKGRERTRLMIALDRSTVRTSYDFHMDARFRAVLAAGSTCITRRKSVKQVITVLPCPDWDSVRTSTELRRHPVNWV